MCDRYDLVIIGAGVAGCELAKRARARGIRIALIEKNRVGGTCLNYGCIPSKSYLSFAHKLDNIKHMIKEDDLDYDSLYEQMFNKKENSVNYLREGLEHDLRNRGIDLIFGSASLELLSEHRVGINGKMIYSDKIVLATGSSPIVDVINGATEEMKSGFVCTNETVFLQSKRPSKVVIIGGGVSGVELADVFSSFEIEVTILESEKNILRGFDVHIVKVIIDSLVSKGVCIKTAATVTEVCEGSVFYNQGDKEYSLDCDMVYLGIGRRGNINAELAENSSFYSVSDVFETSIKNVYSIGDAIGGPLLAHKAIMEADSLAPNLFGECLFNSKCDVPSTIYTMPECIQIGVCDINLGYEVSAVEDISMDYSGRYVVEKVKKNEYGFLKLFFDKDDRVVGCAMASHHASEVLGMLTMVVNNNMKCNDVLEYVYAHPTEFELIRDCIYKYIEKKRGY